MTGYLFLFTLFICAMTDIAEYRIKNSILLSSASLYLICRSFFGRPLSMPLMLGPPAVVFALLFPLFCLHLIKAGDIKLLMVTSLYLGLSGLKAILLYTVPASVILILYCMKSQHTSLSKTRFPFAFALFLGAYPLWRL